jgi:transcriptional regulator with XRE-family HTH domain
MSDKKIERVFRSNKLTAEEIARDNEVRRLVEQEFPPAATPGRVGTGALSTALRDSIRGSGQSVYQVAKSANVSQIVISRFLSGERDIRMETADRLAEALGLKLGVH